MTGNLSSERTVPDWSSATLNLDAYLRRIGYRGPLGLDEATLTALHRAHLAAIRFENLDIFLRGDVLPASPVAVDLESVQDKIVERGRGGYCYEQGQLFGAVLERIGFTVHRRLARVGPDDGGPARPRTHLTLEVRTDLGRWLADVGYGSSPPGPLNLRRLRSGGPQELDGWVYEVAPDEADDTWKLREYQAGEWVTHYRYEQVTVHPVDVLLSNHYTSTHPDSWFTWQPIVIRRDPDAIRSIIGRTHTVTHLGHRKERRELTDDEFAAALTTEFALPLTPAEIATLVAAPTARA